MLTRLGDVLLRGISLGITEDCPDDERLTRRVFTAASVFVGVVAPLWGAMYAAFGEPWPGAIPTGYSVFTLASFLILHRFGGWQWFRTTQLVLIFLLPFGLMLSLGGYGPGSAVMIWAVLAPLGALWAGRSRQAAFWVGAYLSAAVVSGAVNPLLRDSNDLPDALITVLFVMNVVFVTGVIFLLIDFYVRQQQLAIVAIRRNRELEEAYLAQEITLRQSDKLATLGKLSAGVAHELNNPAAAAQQATQQLSSLLLSDEQVDLELARLELDQDELAAVSELADAMSAGFGQPTLDPLERRDAEVAVQELLEESDVDDPWEIAPSIVNLGVNATQLARVGGALRPDRFAGLVTTLDRQHKRQTLVGGLDDSTDRIIEIVKALKSYTYLDQAPRQVVDVHKGLESTLLMFQSRLKAGIDVERAYADDLPEIEAYGSELNQVWTNILDNAIDAMGDQGTVEIVTHRHGDHVVVEVSDSGPGIPSDVVEQVFDPFVTTKAPGEGTGLGLNISYNIVTQQHGGEITVASRPGRTTFTVRLPLLPPDAHNRDSDNDEDGPAGGSEARSDSWRSR